MSFVGSVHGEACAIDASVWQSLWREGSASRPADQSLYLEKVHCLSVFGHRHDAVAVGTLF